MSWIRGKSIWEKGLIPPKRWKECGLEPPHWLYTLFHTTLAVETRWALQACSFIGLWSEEKALWPSLRLCFPLWRSTYQHKTRAGWMAGYAWKIHVWNLVWTVETHWNDLREKVSWVTHLQPAHISYLTVGKSTVKIPLRMWISALICT